MKRLLFFMLLLSRPLYAEELPVLWLEAGTQTEISDVRSAETHWILRFEHRVLASGRVLSDSRVRVAAPPLDAGKTLRAKLFLGITPIRDVILAAPDPFTDRDAWFKAHPIALYDPEKNTSEFFAQKEFSFQELASFADIETVRDAVIVLGEGVDLDKEKGLAEILFKKATQGFSVLIIAPLGKVPVDLDASPITSLRFGNDRKYLFPNAGKSFAGPSWTLRPGANPEKIIVFAREKDNPRNDGLTLLDLQFAKDENLPKGNTGRMIIETTPLFTDNSVETLYYFKSIIETLSKNKEP